ncbi:uncharacterized protein LOC127740601 isoform X1 [Arachis duranensis]|uniref:Uncharacterized protein LOC127740601 isoform X1 n=1 Tax=Arachis duranensis TaxID=130453 RepID=A0A9C6TBX7_ARADU|nr:uncharacterized protein LOC127740601 isoform X1 [Arachis duranensis]
MYKRRLLGLDHSTFILCTWGRPLMADSPLWKLLPAVQVHAKGEVTLGSPLDSDSVGRRVGRTYEPGSLACWTGPEHDSYTLQEKCYLWHQFQRCRVSMPLTKYYWMLPAVELGYIQG